MADKIADPYDLDKSVIGIINTKMISVGISRILGHIKGWCTPVIRHHRRDIVKVEQDKNWHGDVEKDSCASVMHSMVHQLAKGW